MKLKNKEIIAGYLFILPSLIGFSIFFAIPFINSIYYCFTKGVGGKEFVGFNNFIDLFNSKSFLLAAKNTLVFNSISVPLIIILSFFLALILNKGLKGIEFYRMVFIMPLVIPVASVVLVWKILFNQYGVINTILKAFSIVPIEWMKTKWSVGVLVLVYIWKNCGYNVILFIAGLNSIPKEYYDAARIDGASRFQCLIKITIPYLMPTTFFVFIISIINAFKVFREAYLLAGNYPNLDIYMLQHFMNNNYFNINYQRLSTAGLIMASIIFFIVYFLYRAERKFGSDF